MPSNTVPNANTNITAADALSKDIGNKTEEAKTEALTTSKSNKKRTNSEKEKINNTQ